MNVCGWVVFLGFFFFFLCDEFGSDFTKCKCYISRRIQLQLYSDLDFWILADRYNFNNYNNCLFFTFFKN